MRLEEARRALVGHHLAIWVNEVKEDNAVSLVICFGFGVVQIVENQVANLLDPRGSFKMVKSAYTSETLADQPEEGQLTRLGMTNHKSVGALGRELFLLSQAGDELGNKKPVDLVEAVGEAWDRDNGWRAFGGF